MPDTAAAGDVLVREATPADNAAIIDLELNTPLVIGDVAETFDRRPDAFACCRLHDRCHIVVAELEGRIVGLMAGVMIEPMIAGRERCLVYIHRARVDQAARHRRVAWTLSNYLFAWSAQYGSEGPCYMIAPENAPSMAFVERGGGRWPADVVSLHIDTSQANAGSGEPIGEEHLDRVVALVNATHEGQDFFEPLTPASLRARLHRDSQYSITDLHGAFEGGELVAVAGLLDKGAHSERIDTNTATGEVVRSRRAAVVDWGFAPGHEPAFARLLERLAAEAHRLGRGELSICEPFPGAVPVGLPHIRSVISLFTPSLKPPEAEALRGLYFDPLNL